ALPSSASIPSPARQQNLPAWPPRSDQSGLRSCELPASSLSNRPVPPPVLFSETFLRSCKIVEVRRPAAKDAGEQPRYFDSTQLGKAVGGRLCRACRLLAQVASRSARMRTANELVPSCRR